MNQKSIGIFPQGNKIFLWIQETMKPENKDKKVGELLDTFMNKNKGCSVLNIGSLIMASYLLLVYPKEELSYKDILKIDQYNIEIIVGEKKMRQYSGG
ncbi:hypothetical protein [Paenibacillus sp. BJ-4]|uniref:hypothetical protein n=1 Tax=Paenibacillus sp. BJ-4 TaxID=2878097 RepID=UPI001CF062AF|nr:hypothetical protein [Paenibacillus sp. BJ-4]